jgi:hypothetical protein
MEIPKDQVLQFLKERGDSQQAAQAEQDLPIKWTPIRMRVFCRSSASTPRS